MGAGWVEIVEGAGRGLSNTPDVGKAVLRGPKDVKGWGGQQRAHVLDPQTILQVLVCSLSGRGVTSPWRGYPVSPSPRPSNSPTSQVEPRRVSLRSSMHVHKRGGAGGPWHRHGRSQPSADHQKEPGAES